VVDPAVEAAQLAVEAVQHRLRLTFRGQDGVHGEMIPSADQAEGVLSALALPHVSVLVYTAFRDRVAVTVDTKATASRGASAHTLTSAGTARHYGVSGADFGMSPCSLDDSPLSTSTASSAWSELNSGLLSPAGVTAATGAGGSGFGIVSTRVLQAAVVAGRMVFAAVGSWVPLRVVFQVHVQAPEAGVAARPAEANSLHLRVMHAADVSKYLASRQRDQEGDAFLSAGATGLEWLSDVLVDGWMQGACVQVRSGRSC
jgi:hypothetical protein